MKILSNLWNPTAGSSVFLILFTNQILTLLGLKREDSSMESVLDVLVPPLIGFMGVHSFYKAWKYGKNIQEVEVCKCDYLSFLHVIILPFVLKSCFLVLLSSSHCPFAFSASFSSQFRFPPPLPSSSLPLSQSPFPPWVMPWHGIGRPIM